MIKKVLLLLMIVIGSVVSYCQSVKKFAPVKNKTSQKQQLINSMQVLKKLVTANNTQEIYTRLVYSGKEDKENRWKRRADPNNPEDIQSSKRLMTKLKEGLLNCDKINYEEVRIEKESEGIWYVITANCGNKKNNYAFLKINNSFMLGDID